MFVCIAGPICSGKQTIADFLIVNDNFTRLRLRGDKIPCNDALHTPVSTLPDDGQRNSIESIQINGNDDVWFDSVVEMLEYVTKRWRENFVTVDIWTEDLDIFAKRPFFLLVSVDAPISVRWKRFNERFARLPSKLIYEK